MRFRLATLLTLTTFAAVAVALSYQIVVLRQQVSELREEVQQLQGGPAQAVWRATYQQQVTPIGVPYSVEEAMMGDALSTPVDRR